MSEVWILTHVERGEYVGMHGVFGAFEKALNAAEDEDEITGPLDLDHVYHKYNAKEARQICVHRVARIAPREKEQ